MNTQKATLFLSKILEDYILFTLFLAPVVTGLYIHFFVNPYITPSQRPELIVPHEISMVLAALSSGFIAYVATQSYKKHGNPVLKMIALGFYGFGMLYIMHGILTEGYDDHYVAFFMYSSVSRAIVASYVTIGLFWLDHKPDPVEKRSLYRWIPHLLFFLFLDFAVFYISRGISFIDATLPFWVNVVEGVAFSLALGSVLYIWTLRVRTQFLRYYVWTFIFLAEAAFVTILSDPWDALWWFGHMLWAAGFSIMTYAIVVSYQNGGSLESIEGIDNLITQLSEAQAEIRIKDIELREYVDNMSTYSAKIDPTGMVTFANKSFMNTIGMSEADLGKLNFLSLKPFSYDSAVSARLSDAYNRALSGSMSNYDEKIQLNDGKYIYVNFTLIPVINAEKKIGYVLAEAKDITQEKESEAKIQSANQELERMNKLMIGREAKMAEMKKELEQLKSKPTA